MQKDDNAAKMATSRKRIKTITLAAVFILITCLALMTYELCTRRHEALPGEVILNGRMSFEKAEEKLKKAGFKPMGETRKLKDSVNQYYEGVDVCGYTTEYSYLMQNINPETESLQIVHVFKDTKASNLDNPGEICKAVMEELTKSIGKEPEEGKDGFGAGRYWFWTLKGNTEAVLLYMGDENLLLTYIYSK
ncbi:MAG: hypothetical protein IKZ98_08760 [Clostridia bacterium]|nr:hypothetical protein [Clostridia bacterium]